MWELYRGQTRRPRSQIREQEKPIKDWPGGEAKEVDVVVGGEKTRAGTVEKNLGCRRKYV